MQEEYAQDLIFLGGIGDALWLDDGKHFSRNYKQGYRVYDSNGIASAINLGSGLGGSSGLYLVRENKKEGRGGRKMLFVGVTGGVGAGKSSVLTFLQNNYRCRILMTDNIAQDIKRNNEDCIKQMKEIFKDDDIRNNDGSLSNTKLAKVIFTDKDKRDRLNAVIHPMVKQFVMDTYEEEKEKNELDILIVESALLAESGFTTICDEVWYIYASEDKRRKRLKLTRGYDDDKINNIFKSQLTEEEFRTMSDVVINNNGKQKKTHTQIEEIMTQHGIEKDYEKIEKREDELFNGVISFVVDNNKDGEKDE